MLSLKSKNNPTQELELNLLNSYKSIIGIDEAGRGSWAGPIAFAAYQFDINDNFIDGVKDSKLLSIKQRENVFKQLDVKRYKVVFIKNKIIDELGLSTVISKGINDLIDQFELQHSILLIDGNYKLDLPIPYKSIIKGDRLHYSIACASIVAKVSRDRLMDSLDVKYPDYGFLKNKGYGTALHHQALLKKGLCSIHRKSFRPMSSLIGK